MREEFNATLKRFSIQRDREQIALRGSKKFVTAYVFGGSDHQGRMATPQGPSPVVMVLITLMVAVSMTETVFERLLPA